MSEEFREYPRRYEKVWSVSSGDNRSRRISYERMGVGPGYDGTFDDYTSEVRKLFRETEAAAFDSLVKFTWLRRKFRYVNADGETRACGPEVSRSYGMYLKNVVGLNYDFSFLSSRSLRSALASYMDDFFPFFDDENPFEERYEYPFDHMSHGCLWFVYRMPDDRMDLLRRGEDRAMPIAQFMDYAVNWALCRNDDLGREKYRIVAVRSSNVSPYVLDTEIIK